MFAAILKGNCTHLLVLAVFFLQPPQERFPELPLLSTQSN
jgi:hypothetical protein